MAAREAVIQHQCRAEKRGIRVGRGHKALTLLQTLSQVELSAAAGSLFLGVDASK